MSRRVLAALLLAAGLLAGAGSARAGQPLSGATSAMPRNAVDAGGDGLTRSAGSALDAAAGEEVQRSTMSSASFVLAPGAMELFSFPRTVTDLAGSTVTITGVTLQWTAPGYDGDLGSLVTGTSYYVRVASYTAPDTFAPSFADLIVSTSGVQPGARVSAGVSGLAPNTTWFAELWTLDRRGNLSYASGQSVFTTLSRAPAELAESFLSVDDDSATVAWAALPAGTPQDHSATAEGYVLEASSTNFGALAPGGIVISSVSYGILTSTLALRGLDFSTTWYFRVGALNWSGAPSYTTLPDLDFDVDPDTAGLSFGVIDAAVTQAKISISSVVVYNRGNLPMTFVLSAATATPGGSDWSLALSTGVEQIVLDAVWNTGPPADSVFDDAVLSSTQPSTGSIYAGDETGVAVPPGQSRSLWLRFWRPTSTAMLTRQKLVIEVRAVYP